MVNERHSRAAKRINAVGSHSTKPHIMASKLPKVTLRTSQSAFKSVETDDCWIHKLRNPTQNAAAQAQRKDVVQQIPAPLQWKRLLTKRDLNHIGWIEMDKKPHYFEVEHAGEAKLIPFAKYFTEEDFRDLNIIQKAGRVQAIVAAASFQPHLRRVSRSDHLKKRGEAFELSFTVSSIKSGIHLGAIARQTDEKFKEAKVLIAEIATTLLANAFANDTTVAIRDRRWYLDAALTVGFADNHDISSIQINYTKAETFSKEGPGQPDSIKQFGRLHVDSNDAPTRYTVLLNLSNFPENFFPGRMNITSAKVTCISAPFTALVFPGVHPHVASGIGPYSDLVGENSPLRYHPPTDVFLPKLPEDTPYNRIVLVAYPKRALMQPTLKFVTEELSGDMAINTFGSKRAQQEWELRRYIKDQLDKERVLLTAQEYVEIFKWTNKLGEVEYPRIAIAEFCLSWAGKPDLEWEALQQAAKVVLVGKRFTKKTGEVKKNAKVADELWTHREYVSCFDEETDEVPGSRTRVQNVDVTKIAEG